MGRERTAGSERTRPASGTDTHSDGGDGTGPDVDRASERSVPPESDQRVPPLATDETARDRTGLRDRFVARATRVFSPRWFLASLGLSVGGLLFVGAALPLPGAGALGVALAGFLVGLLSDRRRYLEAATAGAATLGVSTVLDVVVLAFLGGLGVPIALLAGGVGAAAALAGTYLGRDLRDGLTREL